MAVFYGVIGAGGHGREVMPLVHDSLRNDIVSGRAELFFIVENCNQACTVNGHPVIDLETFLALQGERRFNIAIADSVVRERIAMRCMDNGALPFEIIASNVVILDENEIGCGVMLSPFVTITSNVKIGSFFHANLYSHVSHDCVIGDFVTFAPGVRCNGNVRIEDHVYVGSGALIKQGSLSDPLVLGKGAVIGMGAVVTKSVPPYTTVIGNPARPRLK